MVQCKILIQLFPSWKLSSCTPIVTRIWLVKSIEFASHPLSFFNIYTKAKEVPESISGSCSLSLLLHSSIERVHWPEIK